MTKRKTDRKKDPEAMAAFETWGKEMFDVLIDAADKEGVMCVLTEFEVVDAQSCRGVLSTSQGDCPFTFKTGDLDSFTLDLRTPENSQFLWVKGYDDAPAFMAEMGQRLGEEEKQMFFSSVRLPGDPD